MSLYERVQRAGNAQQDTPATDGALLAALKKQVQEVVSVDELAQLANDNPERARNEVRSACRRIFEDDAWAYVDEELRARLQVQLIDAIFGYGILEDFLADETITEIIANGPVNVFREDVRKPSAPREEILANAPQQLEGCYAVPRVVD